MRGFQINKQINRLYMLTITGSFQIAGASWVALLAFRGFSLFEIGVLESIFHIVSFCFEIPSGIFADIFGRKCTLILSQAAALLSAVGMMTSSHFQTTALAIGLSALSYNLASGTREALAYDSLKKARADALYTRYASTDTMLYRITTSTATLCAGLALWMGYRKAYAVDAVFILLALLTACSLKEISITGQHGRPNVRQSLHTVLSQSAHFLYYSRTARTMMLISSFIGSVSILVTFFLQAKLPMAGLSTALLGPVLFLIGLGAALGAKMVSLFPCGRYRTIVLICGAGVAFSFAMSFTGNLFLMTAGAFIGSCLDNFLAVRTDILLNGMIPSGQRATLVSVNSFLFSMMMIVLSTLTGWLMG